MKQLRRTCQNADAVDAARIVRGARCPWTVQLVTPAAHAVVVGTPTAAAEVAAHVRRRP